MATSKSLINRIKGLFKHNPRRKSESKAKDSFTSIPSTPQSISPQAQQNPRLAGAQRPLQTQSKAANSAAVTANTAPTVEIRLQNQTTTPQVYAYITGQAIDSNNALFVLQADAKTPFYPASPPSTGQPLGQDCAIPLGIPGNTVYATVPRIAGGRIWFSQNAKLQFFVNPGPGLVEPSIFNQSDPNINTNFAFCEFTFNSWELFVNISYVDFVSALPIALTLQDTKGVSQHVSGMAPGGLDQVCQGLKDQTAKDGRRWSSLIVTKDGKNLRALSPNSGILLNPSWFGTYWNDYINQVYSQYTSSPLTINTQASFGNVNGQVSNNAIVFANNGGTFPKPSAKDIFGCSTGPFATGDNSETNVIIPRLAAAFNRSTLLLGKDQPNSVQPAQYYQNAITNHYSRLVHAANLDGHGYAFPYDDVAPDGGVGQEGALQSASPAFLTVAVGGTNASAV